MWKIEKIISKGDYNYALVRNHPNAIKHGYVLHHRIVVENHLGRLLNSDEVVHHVNGNKKDNRIANLEVMFHREHTRHHQTTKGRKWVTLKCPACRKLFDKPGNNTFLKKGGRYSCCSRKCRGVFSRQIALHGETHKVKKAISGNIVAEYRKYPADNREQTD